MLDWETVSYVVVVLLGDLDFSKDSCSFVVSVDITKYGNMSDPS